MSDGANLKSEIGASLRSAFYGYGPILILWVVIAVSALAEACLDLLVLGRDLRGAPVLNTIPVLQIVIGAWNLAVTYLAPLVIAVAFLLRGIRRRAPVNPMMLGGVLVCVVGGFIGLIGLWTQIDGMQHLATGFSDGPTHGMIRVAVNLVLFAAVAFLTLPRRN